MKERLQKILARAGISSRRSAEEMIREGRVSVNGEVVLELGTKADSSHDIISLDGMAIGAAENRVYVMLNKPAGYITTMEDPEGRPTVMHITAGIPERIVPVGRLDYDTEGLLILTNDGDFSQMLQHPRFQIERRYRVKVKGVPASAALEKLKAGVYIDNERTQPCKIKVLEKLDKNAWLEVRLREGRNRQIRRMFESIGNDAIRIIRTGFGPLDIGNLPIGSYRFLNKKEIESVKELEKKPLGKPRSRRPPPGKGGKVFAGAIGGRSSGKKTGGARSFGKSPSGAGRKPARKSGQGRPPSGKPGSGRSRSAKSHRSKVT